MEIDFITFKDSFINYLDRKDTTKNSYLIILNSFISYLNSRNITNPKRNDILKYKEELLKRLSSASVQKHIVVLRNFFRYLKVNELYDDITYQIRGCKVETTFKRNPLSLEDSRKLIRRAKLKATTLDGKRNYALVVLFLTTGIRSIEAERSDVEDIDIISNETVLHIQGKGKDTKTEFVKLCTEAYLAIQDYLISLDPKKQISDGNRTPLFYSHPRDAPYKRATTHLIREEIKNLLIDIGYSSRAYSVHSLRHTFATISLLEGSTLLETKEALRHSNVSTTQIYAHIVENIKSSTNKRVASALFKDKKEKKEK